MSRLLKNTLYIKIAFIIVGLFTTVPFIYQKIESDIKILLIWGVFVLGYILFKNWKYFLKAEYIILILFSVSYGITILVNIGKHTIDEIMLLAYTVIFLFLLTYCDRGKSKETIRKEILLIFKCIIILTMIFSFISVVMFVFSLDGSFALKDIRFPYGMRENRLWGLYNPNTGAVLNYISFIMSTILLKTFVKKSCFRKILYLNIVLQTICFVLAQSRGAEVAFLTYIVIYFLFIREGRFKFQGGKEVLFRCATVVCAVAIILVSSRIILFALSYVPDTVASVIYSKEEQSNKKDLKRKQKKDKSLASETTGRSDFWALGIEIYKDNPLWGIGTQSISDNMKANFDTKWYKASKGGGLHSVYITVLTSCGTVGSIFFLIFLAIICIKGFFFILDKRKDIFQKCVMAFIPAWLLGDIVETRIVLTTNFIAIIFWVFIGYTMYYFDKNKIEESNVNESERYG